MTKEIMKREFYTYNSMNAKEKEHIEHESLMRMVEIYLFNLSADERTKRFPYGEIIAFELKKETIFSYGYDLANQDTKREVITLRPIPVNTREITFVKSPTLPINKKRFWQRLKESWRFLWKGELLK